MKISTSILSADFTRLGEQIAADEKTRKDQVAAEQEARRAEQEARQARMQEVNNKLDSLLGGLATQPPNRHEKTRVRGGLNRRP